MEFAFYHCIVDDDPSIVREALEVYGRAAAAWGRFEHHIDALLIHINKEHRDARIYKPHPVSFSKKIDLLKKWFNQYPPLAEFAEDIRTLTSYSSDIAKKDRNLFTHSILAGYEPERKTLTFHSLKYQGEDILSRHIEYTIEAITAFSDTVNLCNTYLSHITQVLFTPCWTERLERP